jgi:hypothetical protein
VELLAFEVTKSKLLVALISSLEVKKRERPFTSNQTDMLGSFTCSDSHTAALCHSQLWSQLRTIGLAILETASSDVFKRKSYDNAFFLLKKRLGIRRVC